MIILSKKRRQQEIRGAVVLAICGPESAETALFESLSRAEWRDLLQWLDTSGLALYFLDRIIMAKWNKIVPCDVFNRLQRNLAENIARTSAMFAELKAICRDLQSGKVSYAVLKGCSLWPHSVPRPELRSQLDLDILVAAEHTHIAKDVLENHGYHLRAISGRSWEFRANDLPGMSLKHLYRAGVHRSAELHIEETRIDSKSLLAHSQIASICGTDMQILSPTDLFLGQAIHLFKHICSEFFRVAHLIEFRRHVAWRYHDAAFWARIKSKAQYNQQARVALGIIILLITRVAGEFAPHSLTSWTVDKLPARVRLWVELYGGKLTIASFPGSKVYLLLQTELQKIGLPATRSIRRSLIPFKLPPIICHAQADGTLRMRLQCYFVQLRFILFRLKFHSTAGLRYLLEALRWRQCSSGIAV